MPQPCLLFPLCTSPHVNPHSETDPVPIKVRRKLPLKSGSASILITLRHSRPSHISSAKRFANPTFLITGGRFTKTGNSSPVLPLALKLRDSLCPSAFWKIPRRRSFARGRAGGSGVERAAAPRLPAPSRRIAARSDGAVLPAGRRPPPGREPRGAPTWGQRKTRRRRRWAPPERGRRRPGGLRAGLRFAPRRPLPAARGAARGRKGWSGRQSARRGGRRAAPEPGGRRERWPGHAEAGRRRSSPERPRRAAAWPVPLSPRPRPAARGRSRWSPRSGRSRCGSARRRS